MALFIYRHQPQIGLLNRFTWDTVSKTSYVTVSAAGTDILYPDSTIVEVYQKSPGVVVMMVYSSAYTNAGNASLPYPKFYLNEVAIVGAGGDTNNTLLYVRCNSGDSPPTYEFAVYSNTTKEVKTFIYPLAQAPFCSPYALNESVIIQQSCIGTTLRRIYYDGVDGITTEDTPNSVICGYVAPVPDVVVTEVKRIKVDHSCPDNPVFLRWKNTLGGWDQWLFKGNQTEGLSTADIGDFIQPVYSLATSEGSTKSLGKVAGERIILGAEGLTDNQKEALKDLLYSPMVYHVQTDGSQKIVKIKPGTFSFEKKNRRHSLEFELVPPEINTVRS
jgi:hypothetical protein